MVYYLGIIRLVVIMYLSLLVLFPRDVASLSDDQSYYNCPKSDYTYIRGTKFQEDLNNTLFTVLPGKASQERFSNVTAGGTGVDHLYALYYCRMDLDLESCHECVQAAARLIVERCSLSKEAIVWYPECTLRYANRTIFSMTELLPQSRHYNHTSLVSENKLEPFRDRFDGLMDGLISQAAYNQSRITPGFDSGEVELEQLDPPEIIRGLVQCTPDILGSPCDTCLRAALRQLDLWDNTMIFLPSCLIRFDVYTTGPTQTPPSPPPAPSVLKIILAVVLPTIAVVSVGSFLLYKKICHPARARVHNPEDVPTGEPPARNGQQDLLGDGANRYPTSAPATPETPRPGGLRRYTYAEVLNMITTTSSSEGKRKLGEGGYGVVYYGRLADGREVAVKILSNDGPKQFSTEIEVLGKISHKNLVSLIGYCEEGTNLALIFEYMAGGDLRVLLSGSNSLSWKKRLEIAIDSAQGLDYLHHGCRDHIVHRDVKTPNILLTRDLKAKIGDFGFSKIFPAEYVSGLSTRVIGTPGYVDPQYHVTGQLNEKSDVYSFGVVLLELITGKSVVISGEMSLVQWVKPMLERGDMDNIVDPRLLQQADAVIVRSRSCVWRAIDVAMQCLKPAGVDRPTMSEVVTELKECLAMEMTIDGGSSSASPHSREMMMMGAAASLITTMGPEAR